MCCAQATVACKKEKVMREHLFSFLHKKNRKINVKLTFFFWREVLKKSFFCCCREGERLCEEGKKKYDKRFGK